MVLEERTRACHDQRRTYMHMLHAKVGRGRASCGGGDRAQIWALASYLIRYFSGLRRLSDKPAMAPSSPSFHACSLP